MSGSNCCFLTIILVSQETGKVVWYSDLFKSFPQFVVIHTVKNFTIVNEAEVDVFLEFPCFLHDPMNIDNLISGSSAFPESSLYIWKLVHVLLKPSLKDFEHYLASMWNECNCVVVWTFFGIALLWDWNETWYFPVLGFLSYLTRSQTWSPCIGSVQNLSHWSTREVFWLFLCWALYSPHGPEKVSFHSNHKEWQRQRLFKLPHNCTHFTC